MEISKRSPNTLNFLKTVSPKSTTLEEFHGAKIRSSRNAVRVATGIATGIIDVLDKRRAYAGRAVSHGSFTRGTNLKKPRLSDVDIVVFIHEDQNGNAMRSMEDFDKVRWSASTFIKEYLSTQLPSLFEEASVVDFFQGLCIKLEVKPKRLAKNPWKVDILFGFDLSPNNDRPRWDDVARQLDTMTLSKKLTQTNSFAPFRNEFYKRFFQLYPRTIPLVQLIKHFNKGIVMRYEDPNVVVCNFALETLVALLLSNNFLPERFALNRAFATCLQAIAHPESLPVLYFKRNVLNDVDRPAPPDARQLKALMSKAGPSVLILVDPFANYNNLAARKSKTVVGWKKLEEEASNHLTFMKSKGVAPYYNL